MSSVKSKHIEKELSKFENYLAKNGYKLTAGRQIVFNEVIHKHGHFAAEDLVKQCTKAKRRVSRATIYRSLRELLESGVIRETAYGKKHQLFEHVYDEKLHHHARCIRCSSCIEFPDLHEHEIYKPILEKQGFHILGHEMHFYGICKYCSMKTK